jgi:SAM-dependent methyltransferase
MNRLELERNPRLTQHVVQDLNRQPELPFADASFDAVVNAVSLQYLTQPVAVFRSCARVLRPGGVHVIALSHRCFPTKAIRAWHALPLCSGWRWCAPISSARAAMKPLDMGPLAERTPIHSGSSGLGARTRNHATPTVGVWRSGSSPAWRASAPA